MAKSNFMTQKVQSGYGKEKFHDKESSEWLWQRVISWQRKFRVVMAKSNFMTKKVQSGDENWKEQYDKENSEWW